MTKYFFIFTVDLVVEIFNCAIFTQILKHKLIMCQKSVHYQFVENLFAATKEPKEGIYIRMADNSIIRVSLFENNNKVEVSMNDTVMGYFEPMTERGYKYCFHQKNRKGIKQGYTTAEALMVAICESNSDDILLYKV